MSGSTAWRAARPFLRMLAGQPRRPLLLVLACMLLGSLSEGFGITLLVPLLEHLQGRGTVVGWGEMSGLAALLLFLLLQVLRVGLLYGREVVSTRLQFDLVDQLRERCFGAVLRSEWRWLSQRDNAQCANLLLTDINRIGMGVGFFLQICSAAALLMAYALAALWLSWSMTILVLTVGGLLALTEQGLRRDALSLGMRMGQASQSLHRALQESLVGMKLAKILGNEARHVEQFRHSIQGFRLQQLDFQHASARSRARMQLGSMLLLLVLLYGGMTLWQLPVARLATLVLVFVRLMPLGMQLQQQLHHWLYTLPALDGYTRLLDACEQAAEPATLHDSPPLALRQGLTLQRVDYRYPGREQPALAQVDLHLAARTTTAIIGASGAGKSTLADVLMGLLRPDAGSLSVDGRVLDDVGRLQWRRSVAYVPQETILFNDTIRANLLWAVPDATEAQLWQALDKAAAGFVRGLPQGLDTVVGDQGLRLSGGERQRIALARALLGRPSLLILDEATSALDRDNEERIRQAIVHLHGDLTVVAIGHRMATLKHADQVVVMGAGAVVVQGRWDEVRQVGRVQAFVPVEALDG